MSLLDPCFVPLPSKVDGDLDSEEEGEEEGMGDVDVEAGPAIVEV